MVLRSHPPPAPPLRWMCGCEWVNEWQLVDWYTANGKRYPHKYSGRKWFKREWEKKLLESIEINSEVMKGSLKAAEEVLNKVKKEK